MNEAPTPTFTPREIVSELDRYIVGQREAKRPYLDWARNAIVRGDDTDAAEFFEKGLVEVSYMSATPSGDCRTACWLLTLEHSK